MTIETLNNRIESLTAKIEKKEGAIRRRNKQIEKKFVELVKMGYATGEEIAALMEKRDTTEEEWHAKWKRIEIDQLYRDNERAEKEVEEMADKLANYKAELITAIQIEEYYNKMPAAFEELKNELVEIWDRWDLKLKKEMQATRKEMGYRDWLKHYGGYYVANIYEATPEQIHRNNERDALAMIRGLYDRVKEITGDVKDWSDIRMEQGNMGPVLNGFVVGENGTAKVESIIAGGYNIQRLHVRTLVHKVK